MATFLLLAAIFVISRAMLPPELFDSGLYHFNAVRWINSYPIVPGLGNLQGRLAFNQSYFTFIAALNFYPYWHHGAGLSNSFLLLLSIGTALDVFVPPRRMFNAEPFAATCGLLALAPLVYLAEFSDGISSPGVDLAATLLSIVIFLMLVRLISGWENDQKNQHQQIVAISILAATAITVKLTTLAFAACAGILCIVACRRTLSFKRQMRIAALPLAVLIVWALRGIILSGTPFYPSTFAHLPVDWAVPVKQANFDANWIYAWARQPFAPPQQVLSGWQWLKPWTLKTSQHHVDIIYPLTVSGWIFPFALAMSLLAKQKRVADHRWLEWSILAPILAGIAFWAYMAPDPRFNNGVFWLMAIAMAGILFSQIRRATSSRLILAIALVVLILDIDNLFGYQAIHDFNLSSSLSLNGWQPIPTVKLIQRRTDSGLNVYLPATDEQTWDAPLPATPYFNPNLRLRVPGSLGSGFTVQP